MRGISLSDAALSTQRPLRAAGHDHAARAVRFIVNPDDAASRCSQFDPAQELSF